MTASRASAGCSARNTIPKPPEDIGSRTTNSPKVRPTRPAECGALAPSIPGGEHTAAQLQTSTSAQQSPTSSHPSSQKQPNGASVPQLSAEQPQSSGQLSSVSSPSHRWSPQPGSLLSHRLQSPIPTSHLALVQKPQSCSQAPQSSGQLAQVSPSPASQLSSKSQTRSPLSQVM